MDLFSIIWQFICLWGAIYTIVFIIKFYSKKLVPRRKIRTANNSDILPTHSVNDDNWKKAQQRTMTTTTTTTTTIPKATAIELRTSGIFNSSKYASQLNV
ncbi:unnamed protein product [Absidia cylindrospora]